MYILSCWFNAEDETEWEKYFVACLKVFMLINRFTGLNECLCEIEK